MSTFAWCGPQPGGARDDQHHHLCPVEYVSQVGVTHRCSCVKHDEIPAQNKGLQVASAAEMRENGSGPEGALTPHPALDQHTSMEGSASRGL